MSLNISMIQESFAAIKPHADEVMEHFYNELFKKYPAAKPLFRNVDMKKQKLALANGLAHIVEFLNEPDHLVDYLKKMGNRHVRYGVKQEHYAWVGDALLSTLAYYFDTNWTDELKNQWTLLYTFGAEKMQEGLYTPQVNGSVQNRPTPKPEPSLNEMFKSLAKDLFKQALEAEVDEAFSLLAKEKAKEILKKALEQEIKELYATINHSNKSEKNEKRNEKVATA